MASPQLTARKSLGQHFLHDRAALEDIAASCRLEGTRVLVEIGPGKGALTDRLVQLAPRVVLVEKDRRMVAHLSERFADATHVQIVEADATRVDFAGLAPEGGAIAVGNLPYNAASPIYFALLRDRAAYRRMVLMFQREVAERLVATPGTSAYGAPSVATALFSEARIVRRLPPGAFSPPPKVHSAVVVVEPRPAPLHPLEDEAAFLRFVRTLFRFRRKTLSNGLTNGALLRGRSAQEVAAAAGVDPGVRAERLDASAFWRLYVACGGR